MAKATRRNARTATVLFALAGGMVALSFASVPLYRLFCQVTGYAGTPRITAQADPQMTAGREITVRFDANVNSRLPWRFQPEKREVRVRVGETVLAHYVAENLSDRELTGSATFNVTPQKVGGYFNKIECFCFTEQTLKPGEQVRMPVLFYVDPEIFTNAGTREVRSITLSYTFFRIAREARVDTPGAVAR